MKGAAQRRLRSQHNMQCRRADGRHGRLLIGLVFVLALQPLAGTVHGEGLDTELLRKINRAHSPWADDAFKVIESNLFLAYATGPAVYVYGWVGDDASARDAGLLITSTMLLNGGVTTLTKKIVNRRRPFEVLPDIRRLDNPGSASFPSGHSSSAFALAGAVTLETREWRLAVPIYFWAATVAYGRMYQGVHYPSDVAVGAIYGTASALAVHHFRRQILSFYSWISRTVTGRRQSLLYLEGLSIDPGRRVSVGFRIDF